MRIVPRRKRSKKQQAGDAFAGAVKAWTELKLAKGAAKGAKKGAKGAVKGASAARGTVTKPRLALLAIAGAGAAVAAKKAKGGSSSSAPETYSPPVGGTPPSAPKPVPNEEKPAPLASATPGSPMPPVTPATTTPTSGTGEAP